MGASEVIVKLHRADFRTVFCYHVGYIGYMFYWLMQFFKVTQFRVTFDLELIEIGVGGKSLGDLWSN